MHISVYGWGSRKTPRRCCFSVVNLNTGIFSFDMITLRENQSEPIAKAVRFFQEEKPRPSLIVLPTGFDFTGIDCIVLGISTASVALYYQIVGRGTRIDPEKRDCLISDLGGNVGRFGRVEDIVFEKGRQWRMFGSGGRLLSGIPIHEIGRITREECAAVDAKADAPIEIMPFGKYKGERIADIPAGYRNWMLGNFEWTARNAKLKKSIIATLNA